MSKLAFPEEKSTYFVEEARFLKVDESWNFNDWNSKNNRVGHHVLYYRTDNNPTKATLHMLNGSLDLVSGRVYFIPAFSVLRSEIDGDIMKYFIHFRCDYIEFGLYRHNYESHSVPSNEMTKYLFDTIVENYELKTFSAKRKTKGAMDLILADIVENIITDPGDMKKFRSVLQYIEENFNKNVSVSDLAEIMNVSTMYFSNIFKENFHISPKQYILGKRLFESQRLLALTDLSIREIAELTGFENENYFSEFFSSRMKISALKYRKALQNQK